ncbi:MAG: 5-dehydro-2-deoxygluconokinase [Thermogemmatispora sp.]|uniref:5-dehydro-2-deoxygluconokinase n=1 Tax=Thermogemmatispora sp. TaxID=1968838 RepID=UPI00260F7DEA|nr:5-dehydro-2-deoxygluconokinase [Thermogemmatispora sp.]MBX5455770.1 5-dehydro-2-deoxygluconokinase [Thermogemmatispora sp.]
MELERRQRAYDLVAIGRSSLDLYSNDIGAPFEEIKSFAAYVGGCPTNICVGARRLGLRSALLTAVGDDQVGNFILRFLAREGVETRYVARKPGYRSSAVVLGIQPPDRFPLTYYRDHCADIELTIDDVLATPLGEGRVLLITGTGLSREPSRSATLYAAELAREQGTMVVLDIDYRPDQWHDQRAFGVALRSALPLVDLVIGTEDEIKAAMLRDAGQVQVAHSQISDARVSGDVEEAIREMLRRGPRTLVEKRGARGSRIHQVSSENANGAPSCLEVPGFPVTVHNILGAGDAFAAGLLYGLLQGWDWYRAARLGNACGAILVTRHGCADFMPTYAEVMAFIEEHGGL